jgi:AcrR family transcriptional regulator
MPLSLGGVMNRQAAPGRRNISVPSGVRAVRCPSDSQSMNPDQPNLPDLRSSPFELRYSTDPGLARTSPGRQALPRELISQSQRGRLLAAALAVMVRCGYPDTTVELIVREATISRKTFYELFANKEECVLASYDLIVDWLGEQIAEALAGIEDWPLAVRVAVKTILDRLAADPRLASFCAVEILRLDRVGFARHQATIERLATPLRRGRAHCPWGEDLPPLLEATIVGGAIWLIGHRTRLDQAGTSLTELAPDITYFLLAPYLDIPAAQRVACRSAEMGSAGL